MKPCGVICRAFSHSSDSKSHILPIQSLTFFRLKVDFSSDLRRKYRDSKRREADAVIQFNDGSWALIEVKLGGEEDIKKAADNLIKISNDIDKEKTGKPAFLMVVTKNKIAYQMENGVYVVPLACLKD